MTRRNITIPQDVATFLRDDVPNASAFIVTLIRDSVEFKSWKRYQNSAESLSMARNGLIVAAADPEAKTGFKWPEMVAVCEQHGGNVEVTTAQARAATQILMNRSSHDETVVKFADLTMLQYGQQK